MSDRFFHDKMTEYANRKRGLSNSYSGREYPQELTNYATPRNVDTERSGRIQAARQLAQVTKEDSSHHSLSRQEFEQSSRTFTLDRKRQRDKTQDNYPTNIQIPWAIERNTNRIVHADSASKKDFVA